MAWNNNHVQLELNIGGCGLHINNTDICNLNLNCSHRLAEMRKDKNSLRIYNDRELPLPFFEQPGADRMMRSAAH